MEKEVERVKQMWILNNVLLYIILFVSSLAFGQQDKLVQKWESERKAYEYRRSSSYRGPTNWSSSTPRRISSKSNYGQGRGGYSTRKSSTGSGGDGLNKKPTVRRPQKRESFDPPNIDSPKMNITSSFWNVFLIIIISALVIVVLYLILKNRKPKDQKVVASIGEDWNPEIISKSELELRLEAALAEENYRECIRIYFTFILKELIKKSWIYWRKEKTNMDYIIEMRSKPESFEFEECVRLFDVVWYGQYHIDRGSYAALAPIFQQYYNRLSSKT